MEQANTTLSGLKKAGREVGQSLVAVLLAVVIGGILIALTGESPFTAYAELIKGAFGNQAAVANTISKTIPLVFTGLSVAITARCGMLNIGAEGQLHLGAMAAALLGLTLGGVPRAIAIPLCIFAGFLGGVLGGGIAGVLSARFRISEVIVAIMLNYVFRLFTSYLAGEPFKSEGAVVQTEMMPENTQMFKLVGRTQLTTALYVAILAVLLLYVLLWKTPMGYKLRAVGANPDAAAAAGINRSRYMTLTMGLSGGLAGLAGATEVMGKYHRFIEGFSPSFGFTGIAVAILGRNHPFGVVLTAFLFGILDTGALRMARVTNVSSNLVTVIQSLVIISVAAPELIGYFTKRRRKS